MQKSLDYTTRAQQFVWRHPLISAVGVQINFWVFANISLSLIVHFQSLSIAAMSPSSTVQNTFLPGMIIGVILGILYGFALGLSDYFIENTWVRQKPIGAIILLKTFISFTVLVGLFSIIRYFIFGVVVSALSFESVLSVSEQAWKYVFYTLLIFYFSMTLIINFIIQVNKKFGPGVLLPLLLGKYRTPREEERIFMFMDLKSSTAIAEQMGHLTYSALIRDSFLDINQLLSPYNARVYQYVGDEIVIFWAPDDGLNENACVKFFFACEKKFLERKTYYMENYGVVPQFKAGVHMGKVVAVEIGEVKRDIAYHGDTLNTAARIQSVCNQYNQKLLGSEFLIGKMKFGADFKTESLGNVHLKGKQEPVGIAFIEEC